MKYPEVGSTVYEIHRRHVCEDNDCELCCHRELLEKVACPSHKVILEVRPTIYVESDKAFYGISLFSTEEQAEQYKETYLRKGVYRMSIEIIKEGKKKFETTCIKCGCVFTYELEDLKGTKYVTCPECHEECRHPDQNLGNVHRSLYESYKQSTGSETCLICGDSIPEGRQVCKKCENKVEEDKSE